MKHVVGLSGGKDSTAMALRLRILRPDLNFTYICTPTGNEPDVMFEHWRKLERLLDCPLTMLLTRLSDRTYTAVEGVANYSPQDYVSLEQLIKDFNALPNNRQRWCTRMLKIHPTQWYLGKHAPVTSYVGLRADEEDRAGIYGTIPGVSFSYPMREEWEWTEPDVWSYLAERGVSIPQRTDCEWCYDQRLIDWKRLRKDHPESYQRAVEYEAEIGHTFRSPSRDTWPAGLVQLGEQFDSGRKVRGEDKETDEEHKSCRVCRL